MAVKSRRKRALMSLESGDMPSGYGYCRRCMKLKSLTTGEFYGAIDLELDKNGYMSVCKQCISEMYSLIIVAEGGSIQKTMLHLCRILNIQYNERAIESALKQVESKNSDADKIFGYYKAKLLVIERTDVNDNSVDLTYRDNPTINMSNEAIQDTDFEEARDLKLFWGTDNKEEIEFLEREFSNFKQTHAADTYAEITLLKEVCHKLWDIDKDRKARKPTDSSVKQLMEVMKNLAISPNMSNAAGGGKSLDSFGMWLKDIGELRPEEWVEDKSIYRDVDNIEEYGEKFITSPLRALVTGSREFSIDVDENLDDDLEGE